MEAETLREFRRAGEVRGPDDALLEEAGESPAAPLEPGCPAVASLETSSSRGEAERRGDISKLLLQIHSIIIIRQTEGQATGVSTGDRQKRDRPGPPDRGTDGHVDIQAWSTR